MGICTRAIEQGRSFKFSFHQKALTFAATALFREMRLGKAWIWSHNLSMKMTLNIDDVLLRRVMLTSGLKTKAGAVNFALRELDRRNELKRLTKLGLGLTSSALRDAYDPATPNF